MATNEELLQRITARPDVLGGKPIIRDLRVSVDQVLSLLTQGVSPEGILDDYPILELEDIFACTAYARAAVGRDHRTTASNGDTERHQPLTNGGRQEPPSRRSLRDLAMKPLKERHRVIQVAGISVDADDIEAWDGTAGDGLDH